MRLCGTSPWGAEGIGNVAGSAPGLPTYSSLPSVNNEVSFSFREGSMMTSPRQQVIDSTVGQVGDDGGEHKNTAGQMAMEWVYQRRNRRAVRTPSPALARASYQPLPFDAVMDNGEELCMASDSLMRMALTKEEWPSFGDLPDTENDESESNGNSQPAYSTTARGNCTSGKADKQSMVVDLTEKKTAKNNCDDSQRATTVSCWDRCWDYNWFVLPPRLLTYCHLLQL